MRFAQVSTITGAMITTMRPYLLFLSGVTGLAGIAAAKDAPASTVLPVFLAAFLSYGFGQALTDCFQTDTDALSAPYRPLVRGIVSKRTVFVTSILGLVSCCALFAISNSVTLVLGTVAVGGLATYTWFKRRWWGGPWYNAWIVCVLFLMGYLSGERQGTAAVPVSLLPLVVTVFFGYANFVLAGYFKDTNADRRTGYRTFPVVFGRRRASRLSDFFAVGTVVALSVHLADTWSTDSSFWSVAPSALFAGWGLGHAIIGQFLLHHNRDDQDAHRPIRHVVQSYVLMLSAAAVSFHPAWAVPLLAYYGTFLLVLTHRTEQSQI